MKKILFILIFISLFSRIYSFQLIDKWLDNSVELTPYTIYYNDSLSIAMTESLAVNPRINFDFNSCLTEMQPVEVANLPEFQNGGENNAGSCIVKYMRKYVNNENDTIDLKKDNYGKTILPILTGNDRTYESFTIYLNDSTRHPWNIAGGGSSGGVDINTVFRHELGHCISLDHEHNTQLLTLMANGNLQEENNYPVLHIDDQEKWGLKAIYDPPLLEIEGSNVIEIGESVQFNIEGPIDIRLNEDAGFHGYIQKNSEIYAITPHYIKCSDDYYVNTTYNFTPDELGEYKFKIYTAMDWNPDAYLNWYDEYYDRPYSEVSFKVVANPEIQTPGNQEIINVDQNKKGAVTDTLAIKVAVPEILGSYPAINIKIDDVYVNQGDIVLEDSLWVYYWDLSTASSGTEGKRYVITAEIDGDTTDYDVSSVYLVEAIYHEDFGTIPDLLSEGWEQEGYAWPTWSEANPGWLKGPDPFDFDNKCGRTYSTYSTSFYYDLKSPYFDVPANSSNKIKLEYKLWAEKSESTPNSGLFFDICDVSGTPLTTFQELSPVFDSWIDINYDLSEFSGQIIRVRWRHWYTNGSAYCQTTRFAIEDIVVYAIPDMEGPHIDFIYGNHAEINQEMNLSLEFNDLSGIGDVTADYGIESDFDTITLAPVKDTYNYVGTIPARDHECAGDIVFKIKDSVGNETISSSYSINWSNSVQILTAPENLQITMENDSTVTLSWDIVEGASEYKVYTSEDTYGTFTLDTLGTFTGGTQWQKNISTNKIFYYIIAANPSKMGVDLKEIEYGKLKRKSINK